MKLILIAILGWVLAGCSQDETLREPEPKPYSNVEGGLQTEVGGTPTEIGFNDKNPVKQIEKSDNPEAGHAYFEDGTAFKVVEVPKRKKRFPEEPDPPELSTLFYHCRYIPANQVRSIVENFLSPDGLASTSETLNMVIVSDVRERMQIFKDYIRTLDRPVPQILVNIKVIELNYDNDFQYEVNNSFSRSDTGGSSLIRSVIADLTAPGATSIAGTSGITARPYIWDRHGGRRIDLLESTLRFLVNKGRARILSAPNIIVSQGISAKIETGERFPVATSETTNNTVKTTFEYQNIGISLEVTPEQIEKDVVRLQINPSVKSITRTITASDGSSAPVIASRQVRTTLRVGNGEVISIGGLLKSEKKFTERKVPWLGDIPLLGWLFKSTFEQDVRTQLVFFMQVWVLEPEEVEGRKIFVPNEDLDLEEYLKDFVKDYAKQRNTPLEEPQEKNDDDNQEDEPEDDGE